MPAACPEIAIRKVFFQTLSHLFTAFGSAIIPVYVSEDRQLFEETTSKGNATGSGTVIGFGWRQGFCPTPTDLHQGVSLASAGRSNRGT